MAAVVNGRIFGIASTGRQLPAQAKPNTRACADRKHRHLELLVCVFHTFPGCMTEGDAEAEALENLTDAMLGWVTVKEEDGDPIPEPLSIDAYSSAFMMRK